MKWISVLLVLCLMAEPGVMVMAKAESEAQETKATELETEAGTDTDIPKADSDKDDKAAEEKQETETDEETEIQPGERTATIMVVSITGNELTYYEVEDETEKETESEATEQNETDGMPQGDSSMTPPDGTSQNNGDSTGMPENMPSGAFKGGRDKQQDTKTVYLPVPVIVHTDTDEKRTFSILEAGDRLQVTIVTDKDGNETITEIWMLNE